jgi:hypothetical protein
MILFLDIDGVMHRFNDLAEDHFQFLPRLECVLRDHPHIEIVICSDWRKHHTLDELHAFFSPDIAKRIIGVTPDLLDAEPNVLDLTGIRHREALAWLTENGVQRPWLAIDDDAFNWLPSDPKLVCCDDGFEAIDEFQLRMRLRKMER